MVDNNHSSGFFYDMYFLLGEEKRSFKSDYISYLTKYGKDKKQTLSALLSTALIDPEFKDQLKSYYTAHFSDGEGFETYWTSSINKGAKTAPTFSLHLLDSTVVSTASAGGKWMLLDFWGTWCVPCREEHPELEKFYQTIKESYGDKISLLTIACLDQVDRVRNYVGQFGYTFPVAMSDNKIEVGYHIQGFPSKILISPQGKYVLVPFNVNWANFVKNYAGL